MLITELLSTHKLINEIICHYWLLCTLNLYVFLKIKKLVFVVESGNVENRGGIPLASKYDNQLSDWSEYIHARHCDATI